MKKYYDQSDISHHVEMSIPNRLREIICVITGHYWSEYGSQSDENGMVLEEYSKCDMCGLENHDRSGYIKKLDEWARNGK